MPTGADPSRRPIERLYGPRAPRRPEAVFTDWGCRTEPRLATVSARVVIVDYDPTWPQKFEIEHRLMADALGDNVVQIEHIGSTAVPGLAAESTVDILITLLQFPPPAGFGEAMRAIGYVQTLDHDPRQAMFEKAAPKIWVHVYWDGDSDATDLTLFRDYLRAHPERARAYELLKRRLAGEHTDSGAYTLAKKAFVRETVDLARIENRLAP